MLRKRIDKMFIALTLSVFIVLHIIYETYTIMCMMQLSINKTTQINPDINTLYTHLWLHVSQ